MSIHRHVVKVHRLIAQTFLGDSPELVVDHIDRNRANNCISNLRWVTQKENLHNSDRYERCLYGVHGDSPENRVLYAIAYNKAHPDLKKAHDKAYRERHRDERLRKARERYALKKAQK